MFLASMIMDALDSPPREDCLLPSFPALAVVDPSSGYRYYDESSLERANSIRVLKQYDFSLAENKIERYQETSRSIRSIVEFEKEAAMDKTRSFEIEEKNLDTLLIAGHRMQGPYENLRLSYGKIFSYMSDKGYKVQLPTREIFLKGPGLIFKGNPNNYLTEIQVLFED